MDPARIPDDDDHDVDPAASGRIIDVTDRLTPGAKAVVRERTATRDAVVTAYRDRLRAMAAERQANPRYALDLDTITADMTRAMRDEHERTLRGAFDAGRAYERGAAVRRRVAITTATREGLVLKAAREYLDDGGPDAARHAALVLAGFHGAPPESVA